MFTYIAFAMIVTSMVSADPMYIYTDKIALNYSQAEAICRDHNATLPAPETWTQHQKLIEKMADNSLTAAWLRFKKTERTKYKWVNNEEVQTGRIKQLQLSANKRECGQLRLQEQDLKDANCAFTGYGYICRHNGTCPESFYFYNCHHVEDQDVSFTFQCGVSNWFSARSQCEANGGELARFDSSQQVTEVLTKMKQFQGCFSFWVGFSRVNWEYQDNNGSHPIKLAPWHLWDPDVNKDCSAVTWKSERYAWQAAECSAAHSVICQTSETSHSEIPGTKTESLTVSTLGGSSVMPPEGLTTSLISTTKNPRDKTTGGGNIACAVIVTLLLTSLLFIVVFYKKGADVQKVLKECMARLSSCVNPTNKSGQTEQTRAHNHKSGASHGESSTTGAQPEMEPLA